MKKQIESYSEIISEFQIREFDLIIENLKLKENFENMIKEIELIPIAQDFCDFNLFSIICIPSTLSIETIEFMVKNKSEIKRKFTLKEIFALDFNVRDLKPENFKSLKNKLNELKEI